MKICYIFSNYYHTNITGQAGLVYKLIHQAKIRYKHISVISNSNKKAEQEKRIKDTLERLKAARGAFASEGR